MQKNFSEEKVSTAIKYLSTTGQANQIDYNSLEYQYSDEYPEIKTFVAAGGVSANSGLRDKLVNLLSNKYKNVELILPKLALCGDNAAMIGMCAYYKIISNQFNNDLEISAMPQYMLEDFSNN